MKIHISESTPPYFVYGFTDRFCQNGFPAADGPIANFNEAVEHLKQIGNQGFGFVNESGWRGWVNDANNTTVALPAANDIETGKEAA